MEIQGSSRKFYFGILEPQVLRTKSGQNLSFRNAIRDLCRGENRHESLKRDQNLVKNFKLKPRFEKLAVANKCIFTCTGGVSEMAQKVIEGDVVTCRHMHAILRWPKIRTIQFFLNSG